MSRSGPSRRERRHVREVESPIDEAIGHRHLRLQDLVQRELAALLRDEVTDPRLESVRITSVVLSVDYRHARVHYAIARGGGSSPTSPSEVARALERATAFLRGRLAEEVDLKRVPDLRFVLDGLIATEENARAGPSGLAPSPASRGQETSESEGDE